MSFIFLLLPSTNPLPKSKKNPPYAITLLIPPLYLSSKWLSVLFLWPRGAQMTFSKWNGSTLPYLFIPPPPLHHPQVAKSTQKWFLKLFRLAQKVAFFVLINLNSSLILFVEILWQHICVNEILMDFCSLHFSTPPGWEGIKSGWWWEGKRGGVGLGWQGKTGHRKKPLNIRYKKMVASFFIKGWILAGYQYCEKNWTLQMMIMLALAPQTGQKRWQEVHFWARKRFLLGKNHLLGDNRKENWVW